MADNKNITVAQLREFAKRADKRLDTLETQAKKSILFTTQDLNEAQQAQARANLGIEGTGVDGVGITNITITEI